MAKRRSKSLSKSVDAFKHDAAKRRNIPTAEHQPIMDDEDQSPIQVAYKRRNRDLDPQLVWRGKDEQDESDLAAPAPPLFIQEKIKPKVLIDDLARMSQRARAEREADESGTQLNLFGDFNGLPNDAAKTEFYQHDANWSNRMILGDSLQVMASLAEREGLRGKVQCIYLDPPYGIRFNSNFQWSTTSRTVDDRKQNHITREPEQVKAFRDTWRDGIHSYLTYLRDRLTVARDLLAETGSIFVQIGDENVHRVRAVMDEVFGAENLVSQVLYRRGGFQTGKSIANTFDYILWYARTQECVKVRPVFSQTRINDWYPNADRWIENPDGTRAKYAVNDPMPPEARLHSDRACFSATGSETSSFSINIFGVPVGPKSGRGWSTNQTGIRRLLAANRLMVKGRRPRFKPYFDDFPVKRITNGWMDTVRGGFTSGGEDAKIYVVQTGTSIVQRCVLMATDPSDLVLDPTCGSGTTAYVAEQWGRRWITIDTSRVALALARSRIMGAHYPYYLLADSPEGQLKEAQLRRRAPSNAPVCNDIRQGFVYDRVPHITLRSIANNAEIDVIYENMQPNVESALTDLNRALLGHDKPFVVDAGGRKGSTIDFTADARQRVELPSGEFAPANGFLEWEVPRKAHDDWNDAALEAHDRFWQARIARQQEIDSCIAARAEYEHLYDKPHMDCSKVRVAGPLTVESLSPHRMAVCDENGEFVVAEDGGEATHHDFGEMVLDNLRSAGVQQPSKEDRIVFWSVKPWPGESVCAEGRYTEGTSEKRAAVFVGPEYGTVGRADLVEAAREAAEGLFDVLIACAFNYDAHAAEVNELGKMPVLRARMNADLHMATELKKTDKANLFVIFGEPDIDIEQIAGPNGEEDWLQVKIKGVDMFDPARGIRRSDSTDGIACWFVDTDYDNESFFVRQAYFLGAGDPYKSLKTTLKAEVDADAWATLNRDISRPFPKPTTGRIAVKVINNLGDEAMRVFKP